MDSEPKLIDDLTNNVNQQNKLLSETYKRTVIIDKNVSAIRGWVTFIGIVILLKEIIGLLSSCSVLF